jgi:hypothetical protein
MRARVLVITAKPLDERPHGTELPYRESGVNTPLVLEEQSCQGTPVKLFE